MSPVPQNRDRNLAFFSRQPRLISHLMCGENEKKKSFAYTHIIQIADLRVGVRLLAQNSPTQNEDIGDEGSSMCLIKNVHPLCRMDAFHASG